MSEVDKFIEILTKVALADHLLNTSLVKITSDEYMYIITNGEISNTLREKLEEVL